MKSFVLRGLAAGAAGGAATALFLRIVTETQIGFALKFEDATGIGAPPGDPAEFSRSVQHLGGMAASVIYGAVLGLVLGVAAAALRHRIPGRNEFERVAKVASAAFIAVVLLPALKYPPNPPTVGDPDTISTRTTSYLLLMAASVVIVFGTWFLWQALSEKGFDGAKRFLITLAVFTAVLTVVMIAAPKSPDPINPPDSEAKPALVVASNAPPAVLKAMLATAKANNDTWIRDPKSPKEGLDLTKVTDAQDLIGKPAAVSTAKLVPHAYATIIWHFRIMSIGGLALMWAVMAGVLGLLLDRKPTSEPT